MEKIFFLVRAYGADDGTVLWMNPYFDPYTYYAAGYAIAASADQVFAAGYMSTDGYGADFAVNAYDIAGSHLVPEMNVLQGDTSIPDNTGSFSFGSQAIGAAKTVTFTIRNTGSGPLSLTDSPRVRISGMTTDFRVNTQPASSVAAGSSTTFVLAFRPSASGLRSATVSIANNDSDENPYNFTITGTGGGGSGPEINIVQGSTPVPDNTGSCSFGTVPRGTVKSLTFTIRNTGGAALNLSGSPRVAIRGTNAADFRVATQPASPVAAGSSATFVIAFRPSARGTRTASVSIANNDSNENPYNFAITGSGS